MLSVCWAKKTCDHGGPWQGRYFNPFSLKFSIRHYFTSICKVISNAYMHHLKKEWWPVDSIIVWSYHRFGVTWLPNLLRPTLLIIKWPWQKFGVGNLLVPILAPLVGQQLSGTEEPVCYLRYAYWWKPASPARTLIMRNVWSPVSPLTGCEVTRAHLTTSQETLQLVQVSCLSFILTQIKENIKAPRHWPLCGEFTGDRWIPRTNGQWRGKCFHLMTSSCSR